MALLADGNFWRSLPPAWTLLACHQRSGCGRMSQRTDPAAPPLEFTGGDTLVASTDIELLRDRMSAAELAEVCGAKVVYQPRQVFGKQWSLEGHAIQMADNGVRPVHAPSWDSADAELAELSATHGGPGRMAPTHEPEWAAEHSAEGGQVYPLVVRHPVSGRGCVFCHTLCMQCIELGSGQRLSWEESQEFVTRILSLLTTPAAVARIEWEEGTLAIFSNTQVVHAGTPPGPSLEATRLMHRISKVGETVPQRLEPARL